jgi:hypothetical protein
MTFGMYVDAFGEIMLTPGPVPCDFFPLLGIVWACTVIAREGVEVAQETAAPIAIQQMFAHCHNG